MSQDLDRLNEPLQRAGEALSHVVKGLVDFFRAVVEFAAAAMTPAMIEAAKAQPALKDAPPRIRHLALHSKKRRTRKKNINRALRAYQKNGGG